MTCIQPNSSMIICGSFREDDFVTIYHNDRTYYFELPYFPGPCPVDKNGDAKNNCFGLTYPKRVWEIAIKAYNKRHGRTK